MKKYICLALFGILYNSCSLTKEQETRYLEQFDKVNLLGNIELRLEENSSNSIEIKAKKASDITNLITEVRNRELYIYSEPKRKSRKGRKYTIYLGHSGISDLTLTGKIKLVSDDVIHQKDLVIKGDGVINGNIAVFAENLRVDLNGISKVNVSGTADVAKLKISGIGMMNAKKLETNSVKKSTDGIATIRLPSN